MNILVPVVVTVVVAIVAFAASWFILQNTKEPDFLILSRNRV